MSTVESSPQDLNITSTSTYLQECIQTILNKQLLRLSMRKVAHMIVNDLHIPLKNISTSLRYVLCECLCYYLKVWPGWKDYYLICINEEAKAEYHGKLKEFLSSKLHYIMENKNTFVEVNSEALVASKMVQTDCSAGKIHKQEAPYRITVAGQPHFLNNIGFVESNNNIILTHHPGRPLSHLDIRQLINYPYVAVSVDLPDIALSRRNSHKFVRYVSESGDSIVCPESKFIDYVKKDNPNSNVKVYTSDYISEYCRQFLEVAKTVQLVNRNKIVELEVIFKQFMRDIQESNVQTYLSDTGAVLNTMATNTSICFNIGKRTYVRNKRMSFCNNENKDQVRAINYCEILIPKMTYTLSKFAAEENSDSAEVSFKSLSDQSFQLNHDANQRARFNTIINNSLKYECTWCTMVFTGGKAYGDISEHLNTVHKGEQAVVCFKCRGEFGVSHLAGSRWNHDCEKKKIKVVNTVPVPSSSTLAKPVVVANLLNGRKVPAKSKCLKPQPQTQNVTVSNDLRTYIRTAVKALPSSLKTTTTGTSTV